jgi:hypothetical protein
MKNNQKGFSAVEAIVILAVIGILGFGGWYVWQSNEKDQPTKTSSSDSAVDSTDSTKLATTLTSHSKVFSLFLPDGWKFTNDTELDYAHAIGLSNMTYKAGTPAVVVDEMGHRGGGITTASLVIQSGSTIDLENYFGASEEQGVFKANDGTEGKKYLFTAKEGNETLVAGTKSYGYKFVKGGKTVVVQYLQLPGEIDQLKIVEDAVKTFKFL